MSVETLIYSYLVICSSMIVFNCACIFVFRYRNTALQKRSTYLEKQITDQIQRIEAGEANPSVDVIRRLARALKCKISDQFKQRRIL